MRQIKFKAKSVCDAKWVEGDLLHIGNKVYMHYPHVNDRGLWVNNEEVYPSSVCQSTGLKDKAGQDIYEGDRLQSEAGSTFEVGYDEGTFAARHINSDVYAFKVRTLAYCSKVIGNKFD